MRKTRFLNVLKEKLEKNKTKDIIIKGINLKLYLKKELEIEDLNIFEGITLLDTQKAIINKLLRYKTPLTGYTMRIGIYTDTKNVYIKDYRRNLITTKNINEIDKNFLNTLLETLKNTNEKNILKLIKT